MQLELDQNLSIFSGWEGDPVPAWLDKM